MKDQHLVLVGQLRRTWDPQEFSFTTTEEITDLDGIVGQERAVSALHFGLAMTNPRYHIYVAGPSGAGKTSYTRTVLKLHAAKKAAAQDWVYVHNFDRPDEPVALSFPAGTGRIFVQRMEQLVNEARIVTAQTLDTKEHQSRREELVRTTRVQIDQMMEQLQNEASQAGFVLTQTERGILSVPMDEGQPLKAEQFAALPEEVRRQVKERATYLQDAVAETMHKIWELEQKMREQLIELDEHIASQVIAPMVTPLKGFYKENRQTVRWLGQMEEELTSHVLPQIIPDQVMDETAAAAMPSAVEARRRFDPFSKFRVNLIVQQKKSEGAPVVFETNPSYFNLFGKAELVLGPDGTPETGVMHIKAGSIHRANGGYLVLQATDLLRHEAIWEALKRALLAQQVRIEMPDQENRIIPIHPLRPRPLPLDLKVILIGPPIIYQVLYAQDEDFRKLFKIKAEFDTTMDATIENVHEYARAISSVCRREKLKHLNARAVAKLMEHSHRMAEDQTKLSARFHEVVEVILESNAWAEQDSGSAIDESHVRKAISEKAARSALPERRLQEMIQRGIIMVDVDGKVVGQVNGLTVTHVGDYRFGTPSRITARAYTGQRGILHIEREIEMTGQIHDKGLLTLSAYLGDHFAQEKPLAFSASIAFEQTYVPVDGDSASSTELYALLSALSDVPIDQGIAVTGSVNQRGQIQPIGGVNEKTEGFFRVCQIRGLNGRQGVMIPRQNVPNLMLAEEVVEAVAAGQFHIWAVSTIEEGIEILTGMPSGQRGEDGHYPEGSLFERVDRRIETLARTLAAWS